MSGGTDKYPALRPSEIAYQKIVAEIVSEIK
jgi:hypothetical protein